MHGESQLILLSIYMLTNTCRTKTIAKYKCKYQVVVLPNGKKKDSLIVHRTEKLFTKALHECDLQYLLCSQTLANQLTTFAAKAL